MARVLQSDGGSGLETRQELNAAILAVAQMCADAAAPAVTYAYQWWIDTANSLVKQRNAANDAWIEKGSVLADGTIKWASTAIDISSLLAVAGGTMSGPIAMGGNKITGLANGSASGDAVHFGQFLSSLAAAGYQKLPGGLILQWGTCATTSGNAALATFPITFPTAVYLVFGIGYETAADTVWDYTVNAISDAITTSTTLFRTSVEAAPTVKFFAIGK